MRTIILKYDGECRKCGEPLKAGTTAVYEKRVGVYCPGHEPTDPEEIRAVRQEAADRKADKYEEWAGKRGSKAAEVFKRNEPFTGDIAFNTQPGHIPLRARIIAQEDRAFESLEVAKRMEEKAASLRHVQVAGDAERRRQTRRDAIRPLLAKGMLVSTGIYGNGRIKKINRKTATVEETGSSGNFTVAVDLSWIKIIDGKASQS